jgi:hypothetical protein
MLKAVLAIKMADDNYDEKYTKPDLRREIKEELMQSDKGGKPGEWSARKSQLLVQEYEKRGGGYKKDKKDEAAKSLEKWTDQNWQTRDGKAAADRKDGMHRYLPENAWALLTDAAQQKANNTKKKVDNMDEQIADWPEVVKRVMVEIGAIDGSEGLTKDELYDRAQELEVEGRSNMNKTELKEAIIKAYKQTKAGLMSKTKEELYDMAKEQGLEGRSEMSKEELAEALDQSNS